MCGDAGEEDADTKAASSEVHWIKVACFQAKSKTSISLACEGNMQCWCYRRNRSGHGLYEIGVEPSNELRTLSGNSPCSDDDDEDMSTTQKFLEVADTISQY